MIRRTPVWSSHAASVFATSFWGTRRALTSTRSRCKIIVRAVCRVRVYDETIAIASVWREIMCVGARRRRLFRVHDRVALAQCSGPFWVRLPIYWWYMYTVWEGWFSMLWSSAVFGSSEKVNDRTVPFGSWFWEWWILKYLRSESRDFSTNLASYRKSCDTSSELIFFSALSTKNPTCALYLAYLRTVWFPNTVASNFSKFEHWWMEFRGNSLFNCLTNWVTGGQEALRRMNFSFSAVSHRIDESM